LKQRRVFIGLAITVVVLALLIWAPWRTGDLRPTASKSAETSAALPAPTYVGRAACANCHAKQTEGWRGSHHDLAMQEMNEQTALGDFGSKEFRYAGITSRFFKRDGKFVVRTDGPDGKLADYEIKYTFGVAPLQQYLIELPGGRLQALGIAWDARSKEQGGQRWFHLYPKEHVTYRDELHWTKPAQNWNFMCAECHSTNLMKHYDPAQRRYATTWSEVNVSCEACHGPGSNHIAWANKSPGWKSLESSKGLPIEYTERKGTTWTIDPTSGNARRNAPRMGRIEIEACARCHARRSLLSEDYVHGRPLMDTHLPALLTAGLYYPDGQIQGEVYEYGSFLQSKMFHAGVTCSDCHDPHSLKLRAGNADSICLNCHAQDRYASEKHHFHQAGSRGASCVECHMPATTYMIVHARRDHSLRIPRPDLSVALSTPNACTKCHADKPASWAAEQVKTWYGKTPQGYQAYATTLDAARRGHPAAPRWLAALAADPSAPAIAQTTALRELARYVSPQSLPPLERALDSTEPMVRAAALEALAGFPQDARTRLVPRFLSDPVRAVRSAATLDLADVPASALGATQQAARAAALEEYVASQRSANGERPESHLNLALLYQRQGGTAEAETAYRDAIALDPAFVPAYVNLADLYRSLGRDDDGELILQEVLARAPSSAPLQHTWGLLKVRQHRYDEALKALAAAATLAPENDRYAYVYAVALRDTGKRRQAIAVLEGALRRNPVNREVLIALTRFLAEAGDRQAAAAHARDLIALEPEDSALRELLAQVETSEARATR